MNFFHFLQIQTDPTGLNLSTPDTADLKSVSGFWDNLKGMGAEDAISEISKSLVSFFFHLLLAIFVFYVGKLLIKRIYKLIFLILTKREVDPSLTTFVLSLVKFTLYFILIIISIGILGVETSSFIALFASAGVAIGMALSGTLQNFAGGVLILLLKPYKVGDFIEVSGYSGKVKSIQLFHTIINTIDNKAIILPNGVLSTSSINNYSLEDYRRVDLTVSLSYGTDFNAAKEAILEIVNSDVRTVRKYIEDDIAYREKIAEEERKKEKTNNSEPEKKRSLLWRLLHRQKSKIQSLSELHDEELPIAPPVKEDRSPFVGLQEMGDSSIVLIVRAWTHSLNYWPVYFDLNERFYNELPKKGFTFPFPQMDVHLNQIE